MRLFEVLQSRWLHRPELILTMFVLLILMVLFIITTTFMQVKPYPPNVQAMKQDSEKRLSQQLIMMSNGLQDLSREFRQFSAMSVQPLQGISQQLNRLQQTLIPMSTESSVQKLFDVVMSNNQNLLEQLQKLQQTESKQPSLTPHFLSRAALPFQVVSIDVWNDEPEATIRIGHTAALMAEGDSNCGWTLTALSFEPAEAIFQNPRKQVVKVTL